MPKHEMQTVTGEIGDIFAHRFVVQTGAEPILADLGPDAAHTIKLKRGDKVELSGARKPSELKVSRIVLNGQAIDIDTEDGDGHDKPVDPSAALKAVHATGYTVVAEPRQKPKHFEILAKDRDDQHIEYHVNHDGEIKKSKLGDPADAKWKPLSAA